MVIELFVKERKKRKKKEERKRMSKIEIFMLVFLSFCMRWRLEVDATALLRMSSMETSSNEVYAIAKESHPEQGLREACMKLCEEFSDLFKTKLDCLKDF